MKDANNMKWVMKNLSGSFNIRMNKPFFFSDFHALFNTKKNQRFESIDDLTKTVIILCLFVGLSDGFVQKEEVETITEWVSGHYKSIKRSEIRNLILDYLSVMDKTENPAIATNLFESNISKDLDFVHDLNRVIKDKAVKNHIAYTLFEVVFADKKLTDSEQAKVVQISYGLGLSKIEIARLIAFFEGRISEIRFHSKHRWHATQGEKQSYSDSFKKKKTEQKKTYRQTKRSQPTRKSEFERALIVIGVSKNASVAQIKSAFRKLVKMYHPDRFANLSEEERLRAKKRMIKINKAYDLIKEKMRF